MTSNHCQQHLRLFCILLPAVDIQWLGVHHGDLFDSDGHTIVPISSFQEWTASDERVFLGIWDVVQRLVRKLIQLSLNLNWTLFLLSITVTTSVCLSTRADETEETQG